MSNTIFPSWPSFTEEEANTVSRILLSNNVNYWTGNECREFEKEFAVWSECNYAIALANGTVALDAAFKALDIRQGDEIIVTSRTFLASVSSIVNAGATPVFCDIDRNSQNIKAIDIAELISPATRAILCVHLAGWPCEMTDIMKLAEEKNLYVVEDCAQAHGARYQGRSVGSFGHVSAWSFCQDKIMSTGGEGGMVTTNDKQLWEKMWSYKDHGKSWEAVYDREHEPGFRWLHDSFGTNWRMTEMQAGLGRIQLRKMHEWHQCRLNNANVIWDFARKLPGLRVPKVPKYVEHAAYKCYVFVDNQKLKVGWNRDQIMAEINKLGVPCYSGSCSEVYKERAFDDTGLRPSSGMHIAKELGETSLMFLVHPTLTEENILKTCKTLEKIMCLAS